ncbi:hypothetical protein SAMN02746041_00852 [Desulfacinum hydrothermale DSM 13146]|uniref:20S proteasome, alpha and beta subunits n=1 Tax=Desulfacinum hydrothermale DSM 13146 TaxID=1121390 RepID=A0A1W1X8G1_9BACT|nr:hypothetical protein [Desulfacinum hydrothermale]SMC20252.1 hypothetical protein SAMN02746041_00852 [Desulfacinum hydrothermale DSM 13146]
MTQVFGYHTPEGAVLATDSLALTFDPQTNEPQRDVVRKVLRLSSHCVLIAAGAGHGLALAQAFADHVRKSGLQESDGILDQALPFCTAHWLPIRNRLGAFFQSHEDLDRTYLLFAAMVQRPGRMEPRVLLLGCDEPGEPLTALPVGPAVAIPRHMGFEMRMARLSAEEKDLDNVEKIVEGFLVRLAAQSEDVAPPLIFLRVDKDGVQERTRHEASP